MGCPGRYDIILLHLQMNRMQKNIDELQSALLKSLHDKQQPTVIYAGGGRSG